MDEPTRTAWSKPELIVLVRCKPEESILSAQCKTGGASAAANDFQTVCFTIDTCVSPCSSPT